MYVTYIMYVTHVTYVTHAMYVTCAPGCSPIRALRFLLDGFVTLAGFASGGRSASNATQRTPSC